MNLIMTCFKVLCCFLILLHQAYSNLPEFIRCADEKCTEPLGLGKCLLTYPSANEHIMSCRKNQDVVVYSKPVGKETDLWGVEIDGKRGYLPKQYIRTSKPLHKANLTVRSEIFKLVHDNLVPKIKKNEKMYDGAANMKENAENVLQQKGGMDAFVDTENIDNPQIIEGALANSVDSQHDIKSSQPHSEATVYADNLEPSPASDITSDDMLSDSAVQVEDDDDVDGDDGDDDDGDDEDEDEESENDFYDDDSPDEQYINESSNIKPTTNISELENKLPQTMPADQPDNKEESIPMKNVPVSSNTGDSEILNESNAVASEPNNFENGIEEKPSLDLEVKNETQQPSLLDMDPQPLVEANKTDDSVINIKDQSIDMDIHKKYESNPENNIEVHLPTKELVSDVLNQSNDNIDMDRPSYIIDKPTAAETTSDKEPVPVLSINSESPKLSDNVHPANESTNDAVAFKIPKLHKNRTNKLNYAETPLGGHRKPIDNTIKIDNHAQYLDKGSPKREKKEKLEHPSNFYYKPQSSIPSPSIEVHLSPDANIIQYSDNITGSSNLNDLNGTHISENNSITNLNPQDGLSKSSSILPDTVSPTEPPLQSITSADIFLASPTPADYDTESSTQPSNITNTFPPEILLDKTDESPGNEQFDAELLVDETADSPPPANDVPENIPYFEIYSDQSSTVTSQTKDTIDPAPEYKDNASGIIEDAQSINEVNFSDEVINDQDLVQSISVDGETISGTYITNILNMFESVYGKVFNLIRPSDTSEELMNREETVIKITPNGEDEHGQSHQYISAIFTASSPPQCLAEERMDSWSDVSADKIFWLVTSAVTILVFTLGYYYLENRKQDGKLLAMVNSLQKELLCSSKECIILKDDLTVTKEKLCGIEDSSFGSDEMVACLKKELGDSQQTIVELHDKLASAEEELANSTEAALELQAILDEQLSSKDTSSNSLAFTVSNLQSQLDDQQTTMNQTKAQLAAKVEENELLLIKVVEIGNKSASIEKELVDCQNQLRQAREECEVKSTQLQDLASNMERSLQQVKGQRAAEVKELKSQIKIQKEEFDATKVALKARSHEVTSLQENFRLLKLDSKNIEAILDMSHSNAELTQAVGEKKNLQDKLETEKSLMLELSNKVDEQNTQMAQMKEQLNEAEQKSIQATSRLEVLTNYFKQKEAELLKELSSKESLWLSQQGEAMSTVEKIQSLQQEIQQYKDTAEAVRRELAEQEGAWRARGAALERKAHEQWLARRAAERSAEAAASEAQALRHRLSAPSPSDKRVISPMNVGDPVPDLSLLGLPHLPPHPLPFLPPPMAPPLPFLPPPPLPPHRPPPLGRLSSPPPQHMRHHTYSPDSRYSPERDYSPDRRSTPHRVRSPFSPQEARRRGYNNRRYEDDRYYDSGEERRSRRYDETETDLSPPPSPPPPRRHAPRNHKGVSSGSGQSSESLERISKHSGKY